MTNLLSSGIRLVYGQTNRWVDWPTDPHLKKIMYHSFFEGRHKKLYHLSVKSVSCEKSSGSVVIKLKLNSNCFFYGCTKSSFIFCHVFFYESSCGKRMAVIVPMFAYQGWWQIRVCAWKRNRDQYSISQHVYFPLI